jgi:hypothetical protein
MYLMKNKVFVMLTTLGLVLTVGILTAIYSQQASALGQNAEQQALGQLRTAPGVPHLPGQVFTQRLPPPVLQTIQPCFPFPLGGGNFLHQLPLGPSLESTVTCIKKTLDNRIGSGN